MYTPLADSDEIRLLVLQPRPKTSIDKTIKCSMITAKLSSKPEYEALSYMWGPEDCLTTFSISLSGKPFAVRENLHQALLSLRHENTPRVLWADALCINQDDVQERGHQVRQMSEVCSTAKQVLVWLGIYHQSSSQPGSNDPLLLLKRLERRNSDTLATDAFELLSALSYNEYWQRLWIIQEIYMAKRIIIHTGSASLDWEILSEAVIRTKYLTINNWSHVDWSLHRRVQGHIMASSMAHICIDRKYGDHMKRSSGTLSFKYGKTSCRDLRDKFFGLHALALPCCVLATPVDYSVHSTAILGSALAHFLFNHSTKGPSSLISEASDFHRWLSAELSGCFDLSVVTSLSESKADKDSQYLLDVPCTGKASGRITHVWSLCKDPGTSNLILESAHPLSAAAEKNLSLVMSRRQKSFQPSIQALKAVKGAYLNEEIRLVDSVPGWAREKDIIQDRTAPPTSCAESQFGPSADSISQLLSDARDAAQRANRSDCTLVFDDNGLICFAPQGAKVGDTLCQFGGCTVVALLREQRSSSILDALGLLGRCVGIIPSVNFREPVQGGIPWSNIPTENKITLRLNVPSIQMLTRSSA